VEQRGAVYLHKKMAFSGGGISEKYLILLNSRSEAEQVSPSGSVMEPFQILSEITEIETIAVESSIRDLARLRKHYGHARWRKLKGVAMIRLRNGRVRKAELHWYEAHGIGMKEMKRKRYLD
jgi:hypothetical protein